ncbi:MAG: hypothetical protein KME19_15710 [Microcoleus vaginatus WJT46-NPBG5]|jgi:hypothetical protein|nr:hypothetical protein [Microcoleus vaginatus WJT46-NPBG5]
MATSSVVLTRISLIVFNDFHRHLAEDKLKERIAAQEALSNRQAMNGPRNLKTLLLF